MSDKKYLNEIRGFLEGKFPGRVGIIDKTLLYIDSEKSDGYAVMVSHDETEATIAIDSVFESYFLDDTRVEKVLWRFLTILTKDMHTTKYYRGTFHYKTKFELVDSTRDVEVFGTTMIWLYPYWKRDRTEHFAQPALLKNDEIENTFRMLRRDQ